MSGKDRIPASVADLPQTPHPDWLDPMLAVLTDARFSDPDWIFERKLDGERVLAFRDGDVVRLRTRNRKGATSTYPELAEALSAQPVPEFVCDGEVVAFDGAVSSFSRLQGRMQIDDPAKARESGVAVYLYLFDLLCIDGRDLTGLPLRKRKSALRRASPSRASRSASIFKRAPSEDSFAPSQPPSATGFRNANFSKGLGDVR